MGPGALPSLFIIAGFSVPGEPKPPSFPAPPPLVIERVPNGSLLAPLIYSQHNNQCNLFKHNLGCILQWLLILTKWNPTKPHKICSSLVLEPWTAPPQPSWPGCSWLCFHSEAIFVAFASAWNGLAPFISLALLEAFVNVSTCTAPCL